MTIYKMSEDRINKISETSFGMVGIKEREDLQRLLKNQIEVVDPNVLIIAEEFGEWDDSKRRIDLLGLDRDANLVVIELKRTQDGGHMELQSIRYAAMVSTMTFDKAVSVYSEFLQKADSDKDAEESILNFLGWEKPDEDSFAQDVRIVLVSAEFGKELTTSVMWLNERDLDIRCVRIKPYSDNGSVLIDVQQIVPLPESADYIVRIKEKQQQEKVARIYGKDYATYDLTLGEKELQGLNKRKAILILIKYLCSAGVTPEQITEAANYRPNHLFRCHENVVSANEFQLLMKEVEKQTGRKYDNRRYFCNEEELIVSNGSTYVLWNQWGPSTTEVIQNIVKSFPQHPIQVTVHEGS